MAPNSQRKRRSSNSLNSGRNLGRPRRTAAQSQNGTPRISHSTESSSFQSYASSVAAESIQREPLDAVASEDDDGDDLMIMALDIRDRGTVGCAYYAAREERLLCMEEVRGGGESLIQTLAMDIRPTTVLISPRVDLNPTGSSSVRRSRMGSLVDDDEELPLPYQLEVRPSSEFAFEGAQSKLVSLDSIFTVDENAVPFAITRNISAFDHDEDLGHFGLTDRYGRLLKLSTWINLDNIISVGCIGAVLTYLQRKRASEYLQDDVEAERAYRVESLEMFSLAGTMFVNADTLLSLQIVQPESHPNAFNQGPGSHGSKESLSLYGLFHHLARSPQGKTQLRQLFLRPSLDIELISSRLDFVEILTRPGNEVAMHKMSKSLSKIKNVRPVMVQLHKGINTGNHKFGGFKSGVWATLLDFAYHTIDVRETSGEISGVEKLPLMTKAVHVLDADQLRRIGTMINEVVDIDESILQHRTVVKHGFNEKLDEMKRTYNGLDDLLGHVASNIQGTIPLGLEVQVNVIYFPQLGFHITLPLDPATGEPVYQGTDGTWERIFRTQGQVFFKDDRMRQLDAQIGDVYSIICDMEIEISYDLAQRVLRDEKMLIAASDLCGEIDSQLALAQGAALYRLTRPKVCQQNVIDIQQGRHLLQEMTVPSYVPNDTYLVGSQRSQTDSHVARAESASSTATLQTGSEVAGPSMLILTGPNYSGKSVYQKQVALTVYMAHIGSFVPAQSAIIGLTDKILTRVTTRETVSKAQSVFMIDLQQIAMALDLATRHSLVIIDEFGKGTDSQDGAGLAAGVFRYLLSLGDDSPKVIAATHFHEIFEDGTLEEHERLALGHMEVRLDKYADSRDEQVTYLFNFQSGKSSQSLGTSCAVLNGISAPIIRRANLLTKLQQEGYDLVATCAGISKDEEEDLEDAERLARRFLSEDLDTWLAGSDVTTHVNHSSTDEVMKRLDHVLGNTLVRDSEE